MNELTSYKEVTYPIKRVGSRYVNLENTMDASALWRLQQAVFDTRMEALSYALKEGYVPAGEDYIEIEVRVVRSVVSAEATEGKWITLPVDSYWLKTLKLDEPIPMV